jgi:hypothetical protein
MNRVLGFFIFLFVFLAAYLGMHFYVFTRLGGLLAIRRTLAFYLVMVFVAILFPTASIAERYFDGSFLRAIYAVSAAWLGILFFALVALVFYEIFHLFVKTQSRVTGIVIIAIVTLVSLYAIVNAMFINVKTFEIPIANLDKPVSIVQISDLHIGTIHNSAYLENVVKKVNGLNPDMVLITGDLVDGTGPLNLKSLLPLKELKPKSFFTTGNHEQYEGVDKVIVLVRQTGVQILRDEIADYQGIQIVGIDNPVAEFAKSNAVIEKMQIDKSKPTVLMFHPPQGLSEANKAGVDLQLSGHTHNGQIFPFNFLVKLFYPMVKGLYNVNGTYLYTSPGTGTWGPPMRLGSRNEITVIRLVPK